MISRRCGLVWCLLIPSVASVARAEWRPVAPGIEYMEATLPGPVQVYVARADRSKKNWTIDGMMAKGSAKGAREVVPAMAERADDSVNYRGDRYDVKIAVNGSYFNPTTGVPFGGEIVGGWFVRRHDEYSGGSGFYWTLDGRAVMGGNIHNGPKFHWVSFADKGKMNISKLNDPRGKDELAMYTWQYADKTDTVEPGVEVVVRMSAPACIMPEDGGVPGQIVSVKESTGGTPLLYDHVIFSGHGKAAQELKKHARPGQQLRINMTLTDFGVEEIGLKPADWKGAYASIPSATYIVVNGKVPRHWEAKAERYAKEGKKHGSVVKDPRTLVAFNEQYVYFVVVDGRSSQSIGMTFTDAGNYCRDELKADYAITQDGGGSSTMWVDGEVRNNPSGKPGMDKAGQLRPVANGYLMAVLEPAKRSSQFAAGARIAATGKAELRLGPGSQFGVATTLPADSQGTVGKHSLSGIQAKGAYWWNCRFPQGEGWLAEENLRKR